MKISGGDNFCREQGLTHTLESVKRMLDEEKKSEGNIMYAENWIYAPAIQKEREMFRENKSAESSGCMENSHILVLIHWRMVSGNYPVEVP